MSSSVLIHDKDRFNLMKQFIENNNYKFERIVPFNQDASNRKYFRMYDINNKSFIIMDAPPELEKIDEFIKIGNQLRDIGVRAPEIFQENIEHGFLILEDFGDVSFNIFLKNNPKLEIESYKSFTELIIYVQENYKQTKDLNIYDLKDVKKAIAGFTDYYLNTIITSSSLLYDLKNELIEIISQSFNYLSQNLLSVTLKDYHVDNLHYLNSMNYKDIGLLDFQDALICSRSYDLVSILQDARKFVNNDIENECINFYIKSTNIDKEKFLAEYNFWGLERNLRIVGFCNRKLFLNDDPRYIALLPNVWNYIWKNLEHPINAKVKKFFEQKLIPLINK